MEQKVRTLEGQVARVESLKSRLQSMLDRKAFSALQTTVPSTVTEIIAIYNEMSDGDGANSREANDVRVMAHDVSHAINTYLAERRNQREGGEGALDADGSNAPEEVLSELSAKLRTDVYQKQLTEFSEFKFLDVTDPTPDNLLQAAREALQMAPRLAGLDAERSRQFARKVKILLGQLRQLNANGDKSIEQQVRLMLSEARMR